MAGVRGVIGEFTYPWGGVGSARATGAGALYLLVGVRMLRAGEGGMGEVYRARDTELERHVAVKVLPASVADDADRLARFQREAEIISQLHHPHIVTIHEVGTEAGQHYLAMALLPGHTLDRRLAEGRLPVDQTVSIVGQIARAGIITRAFPPRAACSAFSRTSSVRFSILPDLGAAMLEKLRHSQSKISSTDGVKV